MQYLHQEVGVGSLRPNPWNTNVVSPENEAKIDASLVRFGVFKPILVRETEHGLEILGGQHRWESARRLGLESIPVINLGAIDDKSAQEVGLVDNGRYGVDDEEGLARLLKGLGTSTDLSEFLPYTNTELDGIFKADELDLDELNIDGDEEPDLELQPTATSAGPTHQVMRFKVPVEDAEWVSALIQKTQKANGLTTSDALTNAGDALVHLLKEVRS
jgi:ParB family chromosome partitioning protein